MTGTPIAGRRHALPWGVDEQPTSTDGQHARNHHASQHHATVASGFATRLCWRAGGAVDLSEAGLELIVARCHLIPWMRLQVPHRLIGSGKVQDRRIRLVAVGHREGHLGTTSSARRLRPGRDTRTTRRSSYSLSPPVRSVSSAGNSHPLGCLQQWVHRHGSAPRCSRGVTEMVTCRCSHRSEW
jgi:hypothetical protein